MNTLLSIAYLVVGVILISLIVSYLLTPKEKTATIVVENPGWYNYPVRWGYYGSGLPGWGGRRHDGGHRDGGHRDGGHGGGGHDGGHGGGHGGGHQ